MYHLRMCKIFEKYPNHGSRKVEITLCICLPDIIQTSSLGRLQKKHWNTVAVCMQRLYCSIRKHSTDNIRSLQNYFKPIAEVYYFSDFKNHWNNTGAMCLTLILWT